MQLIIFLNAPPPCLPCRHLKLGGKRKISHLQTLLKIFPPRRKHLLGLLRNSKITLLLLDISWPTLSILARNITSTLCSLHFANISKNYFTILFRILPSQSQYFCILSICPTNIFNVMKVFFFLKWHSIEIILNECNATLGLKLSGHRL